MTVTANADSKFNRYVVGAYPASPAHREWNPELEGAFFDALSQDRRIWALELPWLGSLHPHDDRWLSDHFPQHFRAIYTDIPFVMSQLALNPNYGLASPDESGRSQALHHVRSLALGIAQFNEQRGSAAVHTVELHTAPQGKGDVDALAKSLEELSAWDWYGAQLVIEHCDAWIDGQTPEKGF